MLKFYDEQHDITLSFDIVDYQFPEITQGSDSDWLNVAMHLQQGDKAFDVIDPAIEAKDLPELLKWFKALSERKLPEYATIHFIEPCFSFEFYNCKETTVRIGVHLACEMRPDFYLDQLVYQPEDDEDYIIVFDLTDKDFADIIHSLENTINQFPIRCHHY